MEKLEIERVRTDCLYPSFEQVEVIVFPFGDGFRVSDDGGAVRAAWIHGTEVASDVLREAAIRYGAESDGQAVYADAPGEKWKRSAILAVANASAEAARTALAKQPA